jgi:osmotically-inducible protein OsmY
MNSKFVPAAVLVLALAGQVALQSGCAATRTKESSGEFVDDSAVTTKVKAAFVKDDTVKSRDITVETFKGVVQLSGFVNTIAEKDRAEALASSVAGVKSVQNNLQVK